MEKERQKDIRMVQIGSKNWADNYTIPERVEWIYLKPGEIANFANQEIEKAKALKAKKKKPLKYHLLILTDDCYPETIDTIADLFEPYEVIYPRDMSISDKATQEFLKRKMAQEIDMSDVNQTLYWLAKVLFSGQYGDKVHIRDLRLSDDFSGDVSYEGNNYIELSGNFSPSEDFQQIGYYVYNIQYDSNVMIELWPEFIKSSSCEIQYRIQLIQSGSEANVVKTWVASEEDMEEQILIDSEHNGYLHISIYMRGSGKVKIGPCHFRWSRGELGEFVLGGQRYRDADRREFNYYFNPGDFKPPLSVYFSGWRAAEGFEGYGMIKAMGTPFMLICDPRLIGGAFYLGSKSYEEKIAQVIRDSLAFLGFDSSQLIMSGLSMGTFGALYYGIDLSPHAIIIAKPVLSLGTVARGEQLERAGSFPTSVALLQNLFGRQNEDTMNQLDKRFWDKFAQKDFTNTKVAVAYMRDDDYDMNAFPTLIQQSRNDNIQIFGKGWTGRHNDGLDETLSWFLDQYRDTISKSFRKEKNDEN